MVSLWLSVLCIACVASAVPVSVVPVRQFVFLGPEFPKFALQPTVKVQAPLSAPAPVQPVPTLTKSEPAAPTKQYVLVYPSYQYITTRQDEASNGGFFETIQNYFVNFGNNQNDDHAQVMDAVEQDKPESAAQAQAPTNQIPNTVEAPADKGPAKQKFFYSYATPASTVPLSGDRRIFFLAEQPQLYSTYSGSAINPVFNVQPVPVIVSRSNQPIAQPDEPQPNKVITENVQKFSQIPPVMATVEQVTEVQAKNAAVERVDPVVVDPVVVDPVPESKIAPAVPAVAVEDNRAEPVPTESSVDVKPEVVVEARSNAVPLTVSSEPLDPVVDTPVVNGQVGGVESTPPVVQPVSASIKSEVAPAVPVAPVEPIDPAVVDQTAQVSDKVESVTTAV